MKLALSVATAITAAMVTLFAADNPADLITPSPQKILTEFQKIKILSKHTQIIFDPEVKGKSAQLGANIFIKKLTELLSEVKQDNEIDAPQLRIYCGLNASAGVKKKLEGEDIRLPEQGYAIRVVHSSNERVRIVVTGSDLRGLFYGFSTLTSLLEKDESGVFLNVANINDYPVWAERYASEDVEWGNFERYLDLATKKISGFAWQYRSDWRAFKDTPAVKQNLEAMKQMQELGLLDFMFLIHIYATPDDAAPFNISKEDDIQALIERCRLVAKHNVNTIMICADDMTPRKGDEYQFLNEDEAAKFDNSIGKAHGYLMQRLHFALSGEFPNLRLSMVGAPYSLNHGVGKPGIDKYIRDWAAAAPLDVLWVWTGPEVCSKVITKSDYEQYETLLAGHDAFVWDNSNCFDTPMPRWETEFYPDMVFDSFGILYWNDRILHKASPWSIPYTMSANAYLWNPNNYNAAREYNASLASIYGKENVAPINRLRDAMLKAQKTMESGERDNFKPVLDEFQSAFNAASTLKAPNGTPVPMKQINDQLQLAKGFAELNVESLIVPKSDAEIVLDGVLEENEWSKGTIFRMIERNGKEDAHPVEAKITYTDTAVYLAFTMYAPEKLKNIGKKDKDFATYLTDDNIEIFLQTSTNGAYGHWCFDYEGNTFEERNAEGGFGWDPDWKVAVKHEGQYWTAEVMIPIIELEQLQPVRPGDGARWRANFYRVSGSGVQAWNLGGEGFHSPHFFGEIIFN